MTNQERAARAEDILTEYYTEQVKVLPTAYAVRSLLADLICYSDLAGVNIDRVMPFAKRMNDVLNNEEQP